MTELSTIANCASVHFGAIWPTVGAIRKPIAMIDVEIVVAEVRQVRDVVRLGLGLLDLEGDTQLGLGLSRPLERELVEALVVQAALVGGEPDLQCGAGRGRGGRGVAGGRRSRGGGCRLARRRVVIGRAACGTHGGHDEGEQRDDCALALQDCLLRLRVRRPSHTHPARPSGSARRREHTVRRRTVHTAAGVVQAGVRRRATQSISMRQPNRICATPTVVLAGACPGARNEA